MNVDAKSIQVFLWKIIRYSMVTLCKCAQKYPYAFGVLLIFPLLYLFVPSVFYFLVFCSPILACTALFVRFYYFNSIKKLDKKDVETIAKTKNEKPAIESKVKDLLVNKSEKSLRAQKSVRRNRRNENIQLDTQVNKLERRDDKLISTSPYGDLISPDSFLDEKQKLLVDEERVSDDGESFSHHVAQNLDPVSHEESVGESMEFLNVGEYQREAIDSMDEAEDDEQVELHKDRNNNKPLEWTKDDEKNLMDLGISEMERNKRLESLMIRRRARKLFRLAVEKSLMGSESIPQTQIAPVLITKASPFDNSSDPSRVVPQMPGSAPSVLVPGRNPFDLPYDPLEEKPNLTGDSFQQEFTVAHQKDMLFCRHESFRCGTCYQFEHRQDSPSAGLGSSSFVDKSFLQELENARDKMQLDNTSQHHLRTSFGVGSPRACVALESSNSKEGSKTEAVKNEEEEEEEEKGNGRSIPEIEAENMENYQEELEAEIDNATVERIETDSMNDNESCSSSSSESNESSIILNERRRFTQVLSDHVQKTLSLSAPPKSAAMNKNLLDWSPSVIERHRVEDHMFFKNRGAWHTHSQSVASDLQVEFSDVGSPPLTIDETASPTDEASQICDEDINRAIISPGGDDRLGESSQEIIGQQNRSEGIQRDEINGEDINHTGSSGLNEKHAETVPTLIKSEEEAMQTLYGIGLPISASETTRDDQSHPSINLENKDVKQTDEEEGESKIVDAFNAVSHKDCSDSMHLTKESSPEVHSKKQECLQPFLAIKHESSNSLEKSLVEPDVIYDMEESIVHGDTSISDKDEGIQVSTEKHDSNDEKQGDGFIKSESSHHIGDSSQMSREQNTNSEPKVVREEKENLGHIEDVGRQLEKQAEHNMGELVEAVQNQDDSKTDFNTRDEQNVVQNALSNMPHRLVIEQGTTSSGSVQSPTSVLLNDVLARQMSTINFEQPTQIDVPESDIDDSTQSNLPNEETHENSWEVQRGASKIVESSCSHSSNPGESRKLQVPSNTTTESLNPVISDMGIKQNASSIKHKEFESETQISPKSAKEPLKQDGESNFDSADHTKEQFEDQDRRKASTNMSNIGEENADSSASGATLKEQKLVTEEISTVHQGSESAANQINSKENLTHLSIENECQVLKAIEPSASIKDSEHEFGRLTDNEDDIGAKI